MGMSKALMEKIAISKSKNLNKNQTEVTVTSMEMFFFLGDRYYLCLLIKLVKMKLLQLLILT